MALPADPVTTLRFDVKLDGQDLGMFTGCEGLSAKMDMHQYAEGGQNGYVQNIPSRYSFTPITLTRPVDTAKGSLAAWFTKYYDRRPRGGTGAITAYDGTGKQVAQWNLLDVYPSAWSGPAFHVDGEGVANESVELVHHGFIDAGG
jgi:phage tail-like protein